MALFRLGRYEESTAAFRRAVELRGGYQFVDLAFLRMALYRLGRTEEARELEPEMAAYSTRLHGLDRMTPLDLVWRRELSLVMAEAEKK
jgi:tetratricopeptide (TPR) repeat protein